MKKKIIIICVILVMVLLSMVSCSAMAKVLSRTNTVNYQIKIEDMEDPSVAETVANNAVNSCARIITSFNSGSIQETVSGAGFVVTADGYVITNRHVVLLYTNPSHTKTSLEKSGDLIVPVTPSEVYVVFADGLKHQATLRDYSEKVDLAILEITDPADKTTVFSYLTLDRESELYYGQSTFTFGNPEGIGLLFCTSNIASPSMKMNKDSDIESILIDGNINHGNSGGALLDANSHVIGVVYARVEMGSSSSQTYGLGCAIKTADLIDFIQESSVKTKLNFEEYKKPTE